MKTRGLRQSPEATAGHESCSKKRVSNNLYINVGRSLLAFFFFCSVVVWRCVIQPRP